MTALLDTHILIGWLNDSNRLSPAQQEVVESASAESPLLARISHELSAAAPYTSASAAFHGAFSGAFLAPIAPGA